MAMKEMKYGLDVVKIRLVREDPLAPDQIIDSPSAAVDAMAEMFSEYDREIFCVLNLRNDKSIINMNIVSMGSLTSSHAHPRDVFKSSILSNAAAIILMHNHPSGHVEPSASDYSVTKQLAECGRLLDIPVLDHIVVSGRNPANRYSFLEHGDLDNGTIQTIKTEREAR
jgi:DNA repair protein RadC